MVSTIQQDDREEILISFPGSEEIPSDLSSGETLTNSSATRPVFQSDGKTLDDTSHGNDSLSRCERTTRMGRKNKLSGYLKDYELEFICQL